MIAGIKAGYALSAVTIVLGVLALIGWALDISSLKRFTTTGSAMNPATATAFILLGFEAVRLHAGRSAPWLRLAGRLAVTAVIAASAMKLSDLTLGTAFAIDTLLFPARLDVEPGYPSRMAPSTALCFLVTGFVMSLLCSQARAAVFAAQSLLAIPAFIAGLAILGYSYGIESFKGIDFYIPMALNTAAAFLCLVVSALLVHPDRGFPGVFSRSGPLGDLAANLLISAILIPFLLGWLSLASLRAGYYEATFAISLFVILTISMFLVLSFIGLRRFHVADAQRRHAEVEQRATASKLRAIIESEPECVKLVAADGTVLAMNPAGLSMVGAASEDQIRGQSVYPLIADGQRDAYRGMNERVCTGQSESMEYEIVGLNGVRRWMETHAVPLMLDGRTVQLGITRDISERHEHEARLQNLLESSPIAVSVARADGREVVYDNPAYATLINVERDQAVGKNPILYYTRPEEYGQIVRRLAAGEKITNKLVELSIPSTGTTWALATYVPMTWRGEAAVLGWFYDITDLILAQKQMALAQAAFDNTHEGIIVTDADNNILSVNRAFTDITGYAADEVMGRNPRFLQSGHHDPAFYRQMRTSITERGGWRGEVWNRRKGGETYPEWLNISVIRDGSGRITHHVAVFADITEQKSAIARIEHLAHHDPLTGLPNRALLADRLRQAILQAKRAAGMVAVLFLDLDRFKTINDSLGHPIGDGLLCEVAERLLRCVRAADTVARLGGDEFVVLLAEVEGLGGVTRVADSVQDAISQPLVIEGHSLKVTPSIGISLYPRDGHNVNTLLKSADNAMYHAKSAGRATFRFFSEEMDARAHESFQIESDLRLALERQEFVLYYQPQVEGEDGRLVGMEALLRWQHPGRGLLAPGAFLGVAEDTGLIVPIGEWVLREACRACRAWQAAGRELRIAVNLSAQQFRQVNLQDLVRSVLAETGLDSRWLELEITESLLVEPTEQVMAILVNLNTLGVRLSIDDFGTGYSSLNYLKLYPIDQLKIDKSFVDGVARDPNDRAIAQAVVALARALDLETIAEGVEDENQLRVLRELGCNTFQGYYFGRPAAAP
jgi:diguanylate cyclase (GGDEF)-like protein/PAS domain S-box-containing protein